MIIIRSYTSADLQSVVDLFTQTVHRISSAYYSPEEIEAWAPSKPNMDEWAERLSQSRVIVYEAEQQICGFGSINPETNTLELLYTHCDYQNQGIGSAIIDDLEQIALEYGCTELFLTTSATAWPFYQKRGYAYYKSEKKLYGDYSFDCQVLRKYLPVFPEIRRTNREWDIESSRKLLESGEYGFLSMCAVNGYGYGIPISYAVSGDSIYFHCAVAGYKLENIKQNNRVSFCVVGSTQVLPEQFSTKYESVLVFGRMVWDLSEEERFKALDLLVLKYCPGLAEVSKPYIEKSFNRTNILRLDIEHISGKSRR